jgi:hypothetical protein
MTQFPTRMSPMLGPNPAGVGWPPQFQPYTGMEGFGLPGLGMLTPLLQMLLPGLIHGAGAFPIGVTDRSVYDQLRDYQASQQHQQVVRQAAEQDASQWMRLWYGMAATAGGHWAGQSGLGGSDGPLHESGWS